MKKVKKLIITIIIMLVLFSVGCEKRNINKNKVSHKESNKINQKTYNIYDKQIEQWEYENNGCFNRFENDSNEWEEDCPKVQKGFDLNWNNTSEYKRECVVAVIDSGIDLKNKYLKKHLWNNRFEKINNIDDDKNGYTDDIYGYNFIEMSANIQSKNEIDHGTAISSILCFNQLQNGHFNENKNVKIMSLKIIDDNGNGKISDLIKAVKYAEKMGANICCISLASYKESIELKNLIKSSKMLFVFAAGNYSTNLELEKMFPCSYIFPNTITVANIRPDKEISKLSNFGKNTVEIGAPGTDILVFANGGKLTYVSGTSFAVPYVAKVGAIEYSKQRNITTASEIKKNILKNTIEIKKMRGKIKKGKILSIYN